MSWRGWVESPPRQIVPVRQLSISFSRPSCRREKEKGRRPEDLSPDASPSFGSAAFDSVRFCAACCRSSTVPSLEFPGRCHALPGVEICERLGDFAPKAAFRPDFRCREPLPNRDQFLALPPRCTSTAMPTKREAPRQPVVVRVFGSDPSRGVRSTVRPSSHSQHQAPRGRHEYAERRFIHASESR
jgi:hypothetical protein